MTILQRVKTIFIALVMIAVSIILLSTPTNSAYMWVIVILSIGLAISGIKDIIYFFTMARHMVGGKIILVQGVIILDFAIITGSIADVPKIYILLYLIAIHGFSGVVDVLRALEAKNTVEGHWKLKFAHGLVNFALAIACLVFIRHSNTALIIYSIGLMYSAVMNLFSAFRKYSFAIIE